MNTSMLASLWPCLILISLYKQLVPHLKIAVHKGNTVCDFDTIWAHAAAIIVQLDTLYIIYSCYNTVHNTICRRQFVRQKKFLLFHLKNYHLDQDPNLCRQTHHH